MTEIITAVGAGSQIPSAINTMERMAVWSIYGLSILNPTKTILELPNATPERAASVTIFKAADETTRALLRASIELDPNVGADLSKKIWMFARDLSSTALPAYLTSNT